MVLDLEFPSNCPTDCEFYENEDFDEAGLSEWCNFFNSPHIFDDGEYIMKIKNGKLVSCPLGKWK